MATTIATASLSESTIANLFVKLSEYHSINTLNITNCGVVSFRKAKLLISGIADFSRNLDIQLLQSQKSTFEKAKRRNVPPIEENEIKLLSKIDYWHQLHHQHMNSSFNTKAIQQTRHLQLYHHNHLLQLVHYLHLFFKSAGTIWSIFFITTICFSQSITSAYFFKSIGSLWFFFFITIITSICFS
ncbi:hypothetical protein BDA99DRAFT_46644 [Phascolomyces articulosus]|uniref:Uncharacterized protein n=1 Tax=Phascolomyces articulosus TaxID=60185 RepID=A0AAD5P849_9FUNG|nr:hypothetical protein BDA99DRAFT_46644 [Phascolomyces articulosus]